MSDVSNGEGYVCVEVEGKQEISVPSSQFCFKPKTALKFKVFKKKEREKIKVQDLYNWVCRN